MRRRKTSQHSDPYPVRAKLGLRLQDEGVPSSLFPFLGTRSSSSWLPSSGTLDIPLLCGPRAPCGAWLLRNRETKARVRTENNLIIPRCVYVATHEFQSVPGPKKVTCLMRHTTATSCNTKTR
eukprot:5591711-Amphidinium_carterae.3